MLHQAKEISLRVKRRLRSRPSTMSQLNHQLQPRVRVMVTVILGITSRGWTRIRTGGAGSLVQLMRVMVNQATAIRQIDANRVKRLAAGRGSPSEFTCCGPNPTSSPDSIPVPCHLLFRYKPLHFKPLHTPGFRV